MRFDWTSVWVATLGSLLLGLGIAYVLARRIFFSGRVIVIGVALLLILPPVVVTGLRWRAGLVPAGVLAGLPFVALVAGSKFHDADRDYGDAARSLGASEWRIFWRLYLPLAWRLIGVATAIAWARISIEWAIVSRL